MDKETIEAVIQEFIEEHGGYIDEVDEKYYQFSIEAPHGSDLFVNGEIPDDIEDENDFKEYILEEIRSAAFDFDIDEVFDHCYYRGEPYPPSVFIQYLKEDKEYFENI